MNENTIRDLLARYMDGETTLAEERVLKGYFASEESRGLPEDLAWAGPMFGYFGAMAAERTGEAFVKPTREEAPSPAMNKPVVSGRVRRMWLRAGGAVAAAVVAVVLFISLRGGSGGEVIYCYIDGQPVTDFELAYAYTQGAFGLFEDNLKKAEESLFPIGEVGSALENMRGLQLLGIMTD